MERRDLEAALADWFILGPRIPLSGVAESAAWHRARTRDGSQQGVLCIVQGDAALETADAARRASLIEDPRLLPVDDVIVIDEDSDDPIAVIQYPLPSAPPLASLLGDGRLRPETARSIIGEAASGLEAARRRGLRHQHLDSNRIFVDTRSGDVTVLGVGVEAASHRTEQWSSAIAAYEDVTALVALLYRAMTAVTPRRGENGRIAPPSSVADRRIPGELDTLCDAVLNGGTVSAPANTKRLIEWLTPWQSIPATLAAYDAEDPARPQAPGPVDVAIASGADADRGSAASGSPARTAQTPSGTETAGSAPASAAAVPSAAPSVPTVAEPGAPGALGAAAALGAQAAANAEPRIDPIADGASEKVRHSRAFPAALSFSPHASTPSADSDDDATVLVGNHSDDHEDGESGPIVVPGRARSFAVASSTDDLQNAWGETEEKLRAASQPDPHSSSRFRDVVGIAMASDRDPSYDDDDGGATAVREKHAQWVLLGAAVLVILALVIAVTIVTATMRGTTAGPAAPSTQAPAPAASSTAPAKSAAPSPTEEKPTTPPPAPPKMTGVQEVSQDHPENAERVLDGDPGSAWKSKQYKRADFAGLRDGVGLKIDLEKPSTVTKVIVTTPDTEGGTLQLRTVDGDGNPGDVVAEAPFAKNGDVTLQPQQPLNDATAVVVWVSELPRTGDGHNRADIAEIRVE